jgi:diaminopropionate ammonia-lyase
VVVAQGGVGGLIAGVAAGLAHEWGPDAPKLVACEPVNAACLLASARAGTATSVNGPLDTIMAGLRCGEPSGAAWDILQDRVAAFVTVDDADAVGAMRMLARPLGRDPVIVAGPSGACGIAALARMTSDPGLAPVRDALGLGSPSRVVAVNTEGATDPDAYARHVG